MAEDKEYTAAYPRVLNCRIEATLKSGQVVAAHQTNPKGHPANPMSDREIEDKFLSQAEPLLGGKQSRTLLDSLWNLERMDNLGALFPMMIPSS